MNWPALPFVRLLLPLVVGISLGYHFPQAIRLSILPPALLIGLGVLGWWKNRPLSYRQRYMYGAGISVWLVLLGYLLIGWQDERRHPHYFRSVLDEVASFCLQVDQIKEGARSRRIKGQLLAVADSAQQTRQARGNLLLYMALDSTLPLLQAGDRLWVRADINPIGKPTNPHAFDFAAYMARQGYYDQAFVRSGNWQVYPQEDAAGWRYTFVQWRHYVTDLLQQYLPAARERAVAQALLIGQRDAIDEELRSAYADTGAVHVLAVSGLHVGIIYLVINFLLKGIIRIPWLRTLLLLSSIWAYAVLTGAAAPVLRAASMFTFLIVGEAFHRNGNIYNSLAAAAFVMLCAQPRLLFDVGFQLSYLAVFGIVFFQPRLFRRWYIAQPLGRQLWKLATVSVAAQIMTLPVSLYYFHQFPLYFWLSGWIVVPAATLILCLGLLLLLLGNMSWIADGLGTGLEMIIWLMNTLILQIRRLPMGLIEDIWIGPVAVFLLYLALAAWMLAWAYQRVTPLLLSLVTILVLGAVFNWQHWSAREQQTLVVYHLRRAGAIDIFMGRQAYCLSDLSGGDRQLEAAATNFRAAHLIRDVVHQPMRDTTFQAGPVFRHGQFWQIGHTRLACLTALPQQPPNRPIGLDYAIICGGLQAPLKQFLQYVQPTTFIFDASHHRRQIERWLRECSELGVNCYDVGRQGAYVSRLND